MWRLLLLFGLCLVAYGIYEEPDHARAISRTLSTRLQALMPVGTDGEGTQALTEGYRLLQENSMVSLYGALQLFAHAAQSAESDVAARSGQADAQVALSYAYDISAQLMDVCSKSLKGPERRAAERLVKDERRQSQEHLRLGQQLAKEALRINPTAFVAQRAMAGALLQTGRMERARPYLAQANAARPQDPWMRLMLAQQKAPKDAPQAIGLYQALLVAEPQHNAARLRLALLHWTLSDRVSARQDALAILAASPGHALAQRLLMELEPLAREGPQMTRLMPLPKEAEVQALLPPLPAVNGGAAAPSLSIKPGDIFSAATAKRLVVQAMRFGGAAYRFGDSHGRALWHAVNRQLRALMDASTHAADGAAAGAPLAPPAPYTPQVAAPPPAADPVPATVAQAIACAKEHEGKKMRPQAEAAWLRAIALDPTCVEALVALGWCRLVVHDTLLARQHFERAAAVAPKNAEAHFGLAEAYRMAHEPKAAQEHYKTYLTLEPRGPLAPVCRQMLEELSHDR